MSEQMNLKGTAVSNAKQKISSGDEKGYTRMFVASFEEVDLEDIAEMGGNESYENFKNVVESRRTEYKGGINRSDYFDALFNRQHKITKGSRAGQFRKSDYQRLGKAIYDNYIKDLKPKAEIRTYKRNNKEYRVGVVPKGKTFSIHGKQFKGGRFLPRDYWGGA